MITAWFSRQREFRADAGGAALAGRGSMVSALRRLMAHQGQVDQSQPEYATLKIAGGKGLMSLLSTHPPLEHADRGARGPGLGFRDERGERAPPAPAGPRRARARRGRAPRPRAARGRRAWGSRPRPSKLPSEAPPTRAAPSSKPRSPASRRAVSKSASEATVGSRGGRSKPPSTETLTPASAGR